MRAGWKISCVAVEAPDEVADGIPSYALKRQRRGATAKGQGEVDWKASSDQRVVVETTQMDAKAALEFYYEHYDILEEWHLKPGEYITLGNEGDRQCRFCGQGSPPLLLPTISNPPSTEVREEARSIWRAARPLRTIRLSQFLNTTALRAAKLKDAIRERPGRDDFSPATTGKSGVLTVPGSPIVQAGQRYRVSNDRNARLARYALDKGA